MVDDRRDGLPIYRIQPAAGKQAVGVECPTRDVAALARERALAIPRRQGE
jgi:hypothetical protein